MIQRWVDLPPNYFAQGNGYCADAEGQRFLVDSNFTVPQEERESTTKIATYCSGHCPEYFQSSHRVGFQVVGDNQSGDLRCECLIGTTDMSTPKYNSSDHFQCYKYDPPAGDDFIFVGSGYCIDAEHKSYDEIVHYGLASVAMCRNICLELNSSGFTGFSYSKLLQKCLCLYADGQNPFQPQDDATMAYYENHGVGAIATTDSLGIHSSYHCYSYIDESYINKGLGHCMDSNGHMYDYVEHFPIQSIEECEDACWRNPMGFSGIEFNAVSECCHCLFSDDKVPFQPPTNASYSTFSGPARGPISRGDFTSSLMKCYAYNGFQSKVMMFIVQYLDF